MRKPLVVFTPKSLLRARSMRSPVDELLAGLVPRDASTIPASPTATPCARVVLATGKVGHDALAARDEAGAPVAVVRVEQLYPWPYDQLDEIVAGYPNAKEIVWLQEEPENMGAWSFVKGRLYERFDDSHDDPSRVAPESGSPATRLAHGPRPGAGRAPRPRRSVVVADASAEREADHLRRARRWPRRGRPP